MAEYDEFQLLQIDISIKLKEKKINELSESTLKQLQEISTLVNGENAKPIKDTASDMFTMVVVWDRITMYRNPFNVTIKFSTSPVISDHGNGFIVVELIIHGGVPHKHVIEDFKIPQNKHGQLLFPVTKEFFIDQLVEYIVTMTKS